MIIIYIYNNWQSVPTPPPLLPASPSRYITCPHLYKFCQTTPPATLFVALFLWLNVNV